MTPYTPEEQLAAQIIASLIYPGYPGGPDLETDAGQLGLYGPAVSNCRDPYEMATISMVRDGILRDCTGDAATAWEGMRQMSSPMRPYARLEPLIRELGSVDTPPAPLPKQLNGQHKPTVNTKTGEIKEYVVNDARPNIINALELRIKEFPNLVWTVDGLIPEGLCMLAGKPKSKKSWLALGIAVAVSSGGKAFNYYDVSAGRVLYLDLESNQRRMKSRLQGIISEREAWPTNFDIATDWKRGSEGIALLDGYCEAHPDTRLIVIDIWARFRPSRDPKADAYEQDYNALQELNAWAESRNVTVIVIHHTRKAKSEDVFEEISGTTGIVGAVATALILTRSPDMPDEQLLHMTGRDLIIDEPIALKWDNYTCQHIFVATGAEASSSAERRKILSVMADDQEYHLKDLAAAVGKSMKALDNHLRRLMDDRLIQRTGRGRYAKIPQLSTESHDRVDNVELVDSVDYMDSVDSLVTKHSTSDQGRGIARGIGLGQQDALNPQFHVSHVDSTITPIDAIPRNLHMTTRMMLTSDSDRNVEAAQSRCAEYGIDYEAARAWAIQYAKDH